ncbi:MAG: amino acid ABC transporter permease [Candidatus Riflebacteria bacterium]|nr:amino acid ABC transporter permease [Candidatus Riflebacteria bacterium]
MTLDFSILWQKLPLLLEGAAITLEITFAALVLGTAVGFLVALTRLLQVPVLRQLGRVYVLVFRGTPLLVQLFILYFGLPSVGIKLGPWPAAILGLGLNTGAYVSEIIRAAVESIDRAQWEAGLLEARHLTVLWFIVLPQAVRRMLPPLTNQFISTLKNSSLVSLLTIEELFRRGEQVIYSTFRAFEIYLGVAAIYLLMTTVLSTLQDYLEARLD